MQELLAPVRIEFYTQDWQLLETKDSLAGVMSEITDINQDFLSFRHVSAEYVATASRFVARELFHAIPLEKASVATKLSWLAKRKTTRVEDMAYCMLGILNINMPLLCGEGNGSFRRL